MSEAGYHLIKLDLDSTTIGRADPEGEHERRVAIADLLEANYFAPLDAQPGPYILRLAVEDQRLVFDVSYQNGDPVHTFVFALGPLRRIIKDYFLICESYYEAVRDASLSHIEAIDMGRRGVHNEGSSLLKERLEGKINVDFETARRLFTLICALSRRSLSA